MFPNFRLGILSMYLWATSISWLGEKVNEETVVSKDLDTTLSYQWQRQDTASQSLRSVKILMKRWGWVMSEHRWETLGCGDKSPGLETRDQHRHEKWTGPLFEWNRWVPSSRSQDSRDCVMKCSQTFLFVRARVMWMRLRIKLAKQ